MSDERSIFVKYRQIIFAVVAFMMVDALVIGINYYNTFKADESSVSINLSGRQRMLSQRLTKVLLLLEQSLKAGNGAAVTVNLKELQQTVDLFDTTLKGFRDGGVVTGGDGHPTPLVRVETDASRQIVADAYAIWTPYLDRLRPMLGGAWDFTPGQLQMAVTYARDNNLQVLRLMNDLTTDLEEVAQKRANTLRIILAAGILMALINFGYTVFISLRGLMRSDAELAQARGETSEILATVQEGLFLLTKDKKLGTQFSDSLSGILRHEIEPGMDFLPLLRAMMPEKTCEAAVDYIDLLLGDQVKESLVSRLNPLTCLPVTVTDPFGKTQDRHLSFFFNRVVVDRKISHLLVTIQDVTDKVTLARQVEQAKDLAKKEVEALLRLIDSDFDSLRQFIERTGHALAQINEKISQSRGDTRARLDTLNFILRTVHGIKGEAAVLGIDTLENYAHECEKEMIVMREHAEPRGGDHVLRIAVLLKGFYERHGSFAQVVSRLGEAMGKKAENAGPTPFVKQISALAQRIAADRGKQVEVDCQLEPFASLPEVVVQELQSLSIQLVRNALTHGIESPDERDRLGKPQAGALSLVCGALSNGRYTFTVRDDGRGIDPDRLRKRLVESGRLDAEDAAALGDREITRLIFQPGVSTADVADRDAGHGIGMDTVLEKVKKIGGYLRVESRPDIFTEYVIQFCVANRGRNEAVDC
jgi:signal transduction histidine kinase